MSDADTVEIANLIHHKWSEVCKALDTVEKLKDDGSPDWHLFYADMLAGARAEEKKWFGIRTRFINENREIINKAYGLS